MVIYVVLTQIRIALRSRSKSHLMHWQSNPHNNGANLFHIFSIFSNPFFFFFLPRKALYLPQYDTKNYANLVTMIKFEQSYAEKVVQYLSNSDTSSYSLTVDNETKDVVKLIRWSQKKCMGVLPSRFPEVGEILRFKKSSQTGVYLLQDKLSNASFICHDDRASKVPIFYFQCGSRPMIHVMNCEASYTYVIPSVCAKTTSVLNFTYLLHLFQKKIVQWCFSFFSCNVGTHIISECGLSRRFPALLALTPEERDICVDEAVSSLSMGALVYFNKSVLWGSRERKRINVTLLSSAELALTEDFERHLANCWISCHHHLTNILTSLSTLQRRVNEGYVMKSTILVRSIAIVLSIVSFALYYNGSTKSPDRFFKHLSLLTQLNTVDLQMVKAICDTEVSPRANEEVGHIFLAVALKTRFFSAALPSTPHGEQSVDPFSLFSQLPQKNKVALPAVPFFSIEYSNLKSEQLDTLPTSARLLPMETQIPLSLKNFIIGKFDLCFLRKLDEESLGLIIRANYQRGRNREAEDDALEAIRVSARKRRTA